MDKAADYCHYLYCCLPLSAGVDDEMALFVHGGPVFDHTLDRVGAEVTQVFVHQGVGLHVSVLPLAVRPSGETARAGAHL